jgi:hypothetical protein
MVFTVRVSQTILKAVYMTFSMSIQQYTLVSIQTQMLLNQPQDYLIVSKTFIGAKI